MRLYEAGNSVKGKILEKISWYGKMQKQKL